MGRYALIGAASGWGAGFRQTADGPDALRALGLDEDLREAGIDARWQAMVHSEKHWRDHPDLTAPEIFGLVTRHNAALADQVAAALAARRFPVVLGGDHASAMGTWGGLARGLARQPFGLIWIDAHLDAHTPETTPSMNPHGMSAAALLGHGPAPFLALCGGVLRPEHLCYIGVRSYEPGERALLHRLGVRILHMEEVKERGIGAALAEALAIATRGTTGFGVTIDLDGFDPQDAPGIGLKEPDGLHAAAMLPALAQIARHPALTALEIVEYIPHFDRDHQTAQLVKNLILALLAPLPRMADALTVGGR